ncbi:MAG: ATP-binding protein, partial [bacterium]|nr:ATP-binding protein [bacterium]
MTEEKQFKTFNTSGLCIPDDHYMVDPLKRMEEVEGLIKEKLYFTIHAPRQSGKTTYLHALARKLNAEGKYTALIVSFEQAGYKSIPVDEATKLLNYSIFTSALRNLPR